MTTQQLLDVLRDVPSGPERAAIVEELGVDAAHVGQTYQVTTCRGSNIHSDGFRKLLAGEWIMPAEASRRRIDHRLQRNRFSPREWSRSYLGVDYGYAPTTSVLMLQRLPGDSYTLVNHTARTAAEPFSLRIDWSER